MQPHSHLCIFQGDLDSPRQFPPTIPYHFLCLGSKTSDKAYTFHTMPFCLIYMEHKLQGVLPEELISFKLIMCAKKIDYSTS